MYSTASAVLKMNKALAGFSMPEKRTTTETDEKTAGPGSCLKLPIKASVPVVRKPNFEIPKTQVKFL